MRLAKKMPKTPPRKSKFLYTIACGWQNKMWATVNANNDVEAKEMLEKYYPLEKFGYIVKVVKRTQ